MRKALAIAALPLVLAGCADNLQGEVTEKHVDPGFMWTYMQPIYTSTCSGKPTVCTSHVSSYIPIIYWVPPCYSIAVKGKHSGDTCLDESKWNKVNVGDEYVGADVSAKDRKVKRGEGK